MLDKGRVPSGRWYASPEGRRPKTESCRRGPPLLILLRIAKKTRNKMSILSKLLVTLIPLFLCLAVVVQPTLRLLGVGRQFSELNNDSCRSLVGTS